MHSNTPTPLNLIPVSDRKEIKRILVIKPSSLGDIIHTFPVIALLYKSLPGVKIDWVVNSNAVSILDYMEDYLNGVIEFRRNEFKSGSTFKELKRLVKEIRSEKYDAVLDIQGLMRSGLMTLIAKAEEKVGFSNPKEKIAKFAYNRKIRVPDDMFHAIEKNLFMTCKFLNIEYTVPDFKIPRIAKYDSLLSDILEKFNLNSSNCNYVVLNPGARWNSKRWSTSFYAEVADAVCNSDSKMQIFLTGSSDEEDLGSEIIGLCKIAKPLSLIGKTSMIELVEVLRNASAIVTNDSGPMHIAAALGIRVYAMFGATDPDLTGPFWPNSRVFQHKTGCIKCFKRKCTTGELQCQTVISAVSLAEIIIKELN